MDRTGIQKWLVIGALFLPVGVIADLSAETIAIDRFLAKEVVEAQWHPKSLTQSPSSPFWVRRWARGGGKIGIYPQTTVRLNDRDVNSALSEINPKVVEIKVAYNDNAIAVWLQWSDPTYSKQNRDEPSSFGDAVAVEIPLNFGRGKRLPYIGMGDPNAPVYVAQQKYFVESTIKREFIGKGYSTLQSFSRKQSDSSLGEKSKMEYDVHHQQWRALFYFKKDNVRVGDRFSFFNQGIVPFALAFWDGALRERGGNKLFSAWRFIRFTKNRQDKEFLNQLSVGYHPSAKGDPVKGENVFLSSCVGCHGLPSKSGRKGQQQPLLGPNLDDAGLTATYSNLKESMLDPNTVILKNLSPLRHYDKSNSNIGGVGGPFPVNSALMWHIGESEQSMKSKMPKLNLSPEMVNDLIAYLRRGSNNRGEGE